MKEQDAAHSFYRIEYDNDTGPRDESFYEWWTVIEIKTDEEVCKCDKEQVAIDIVASLTELTRLRSELQDTKDYFEKQQKHLIDEHFNDLQQERENVIREVMEEFDALEYAKYTVLEINQVLQSLIAKSKAK